MPNADDHEPPYLLEIYTPEDTIEHRFDAPDWQTAERIAHSYCQRKQYTGPYYITYTVTHDDNSTESVTWQPGDYAPYPELSEE